MCDMFENVILSDSASMADLESNSSPRGVSGSQPPVLQVMAALRRLSFAVG